MNPLLIPFAIAIGAILGALSRFYLTEWTKTAFGTNFPYGTFIINITGCILMGFFFTLSNSIESYPKELDLLIRTGFIGSYTTFSTYGWDSLSLWCKNRKTATAFYWLGSAILGVAAIYFGVFIAQLFCQIFP